MDAGNTWLDSHQLYINPINCLIYIEDQENSCTLELDIPTEYEVATGLETKEHMFVKPLTSTYLLTARFLLVKA